MSIKTPPTLSEFLLARIGEDEDAAREATWGAWSAEGVWTDQGNQEWEIGVPEQDGTYGRPIIAGIYGPNARADVSHMARHDPARVLAEADAKRRIVDQHAPYYGSGDCPVCADGADLDHGEVTVDRLRYPCPTLRLLALPYADHPDYRQEWKP